MKTYSFTLYLSGADELTQELEDALFEAGCDDAAPGIRGGVLRLGFDREAASFHEAVISAMEDVKRGRPDLIIDRVEHDVIEGGVPTAARAELQTIERVNSGLQALRALPFSASRLASVA